MDVKYAHEILTDTVYFDGGHKACVTALGRVHDSGREYFLANSSDAVLVDQFTQDGAIT